MYGYLLVFKSILTVDIVLPFLHFRNRYLRIVYSLYRIKNETPIKTFTVLFTEN